MDDYLSVQHLSKTFGQGSNATLAIDDLSFTLGRGKFLSILGPSGCGKSTLFNIMAGLLGTDRGDVLLDGTSVVGKPGRMGYMLQRDLLLPWKTIADNTMLGQTLHGISRKTVWPKAQRLMSKCSIGGVEDRYPDQLSGGMRQRAALIRTLLTEKEVLLLDEPYGALDAITRSHLQQLLLERWEETQNTILFVTHDIEEALLLADEVIMLSARPGRIIEHIEVPFQRPRKEELLFNPEFVRLRYHMYALLKEQVGNSMD